MEKSSHILPQIIKDHLAHINALCLKHKVKTLWIFGSAVREDFTSTSDIDFLYEMDDDHILESESYECFWGFHDALKSLLQKEIDLVWYNGIRNPFFKEEVDETKIMIYGQKDQKVSI